MVDATIDPVVLGELEQLRETLLVHLEGEGARHPELFAWIQVLDRLQISIDSGEIREDEALAQISSIAQASQELSSRMAAMKRATMVRDSVPRTRRDERLARNQARLVQRAMAELAEREMGEAESAQAALLDYARIHQRSGAEGLPEPAEMQKGLSQTIREREVMIVSRASLEAAARQDAVERTSLADEGRARRSSGDPARDFERILERFDVDGATSFRAQLEAGTMVMLETETDPRGVVKSVQVRGIASRDQDERQAPAETPEATQGEAGDAPEQDAEVVTRLSSVEAELDQAQARLQAMRQALAEDTAATDAERQQIEAESARVQSLEAEAQLERERFDAARGDSRRQSAVEELVQASRAAARAVLHRQVQRMQDVVKSFVTLARDAMASAEEDEALAIRERIASVDPLLDAMGALNASPSAEGVRSWSAQLLDVMTLPQLEGSSELGELTQRARSISDNAELAAAATQFAPEIPEPELDEPSDAAAEAETARVQLSRNLANFEQTYITTSTLGERVFAVADLLGEPAGDTPGLQPARMARTGALGTQQIARLDYAGVQQETQRQLQALRGLSSESDNAFDLYAESAGLELTGNNRRALQQGAPQVDISSDVMARAVRSLIDRSNVTQRAAQLARSMGRRGANRSTTDALGVELPHNLRNEARTMPLFKRKIGVDRKGDMGRVYLPALYRVSGLVSDNAPLRKSSYSGADPLAGDWALLKGRGGSNDESGLLKVVKKYFADGVDGGEERDIDEEGSGGDSVAKWVKSRRAKFDAELSPEDAFQTGAIDAASFAGDLRAEAQQVPGHLRDELRSLFPNIDEVTIHIGQAGMAAAKAAGAVAMTVGTHIFGDLSDIGILAHELTHTGHFGDSGSVSSKEEEAEDMEARVRHAFGEGDLTLAVEGRGPARETGDVLTATDATSPDAGSTDSSVGGSFDRKSFVHELAVKILKRIGEDMDKYSN